jgi:pimeloyl-ACP methyl ester carboxylesterase
LNLDSFALFGFSQGGPISIAYTAAHPQRVTHLILYGTYARGAAVTSAAIRESLIQLIRASWGLGSGMLSEIFFPGGNADHQAYFKRFQKKAATGEMAARLLQAEAEWDVTEMLPKISPPALVLHRKREKAIPLGAGRELAAGTLTVTPSDGAPGSNR